MADVLLFNLLIEICGSVGQDDHVNIRETASLLTHFHAVPAKRLHPSHQSIQPQEGK